MIETDKLQHRGGSRQAAFIDARRMKQEEVSLIDILVLLTDRMGLIARVTATCAVISVILSFVLPSRYTATVTLLPPPANSSLASALTSDLGGGASQLGNLSGLAAMATSTLGLTNRNDKYVGMLTSRVVEDAVIQNLGLMKEYRKEYISDARRKLESRTEVNGDGKDGLIHISVEDRSPERAVEIANSYVEQFRRLSRGIAVSEASQRRIFFEQQLVQAKDKLADAEESLKETEQTTGVIQLNSQAQALIGTASTLRAQIVAHETMIQGLEAYATDQNASLVQANRELDSLRAQLAELNGSDESTNGLIVPKGLVPQVGLEYVRKVRDVKYYETIFELLAKQYELAKLDEAKAGAIIQVVDPTTLPDKRSFPKRILIIVGGTAIGFSLGIFLVLAQADLARLECDPEDRAKVDALKRNLWFRRTAGSSEAAIGRHV